MTDTRDSSLDLTVPREADVVIVGGGPVGSALAIELALRGIRPVIVERRNRIQTENVRARNTSIRTLETCRKWGIADRFRAARTLPREWHTGMIVRNRIDGWDLCPPIFGGRPIWTPFAEWSEIGAEAPEDLPQYVLNRVFRERAEELGADLRRGFEVEELAQDGDGVDLTVRSVADDSTHRIRAKYVVGCDGGRSVVRRSVGIEQIETEPVGRLINFVFEFPNAWEQLGVDPGVLIFVLNGETSGLITPYDGDRWRVGIGPVPVDLDLSGYDLIAETKKFIGKDVDIEAVSFTTHLIQKRIAETRRKGRVLIAGDAAQAFPPHLGQNLNTGVGDAVSLGWMLAGVLNGWAPEGLLDVYSEERIGISHMLADASLAIDAGSTEVWRELASDPNLEEDTPEGALARERVGQGINDVMGTGADGLVYDHRFTESPVVIGDGESGPAFDPLRYQPSSVPGHRAPNVWLSDDLEHPLIDLFGLDFTLISQGDPAEAARFAEAARAEGIPLEVVEIADERVRDLYPRDLTLIRPDRIVAWRADRVPADPKELISRIRSAGSDQLVAA
jgi:2-polyprenyl-6-methoxyphenol hydroxylase-like FAD-dependent oxidoreductase